MGLQQYLTAPHNSTQTEIAMTLRLNTVVASTRPGRAGLAVGTWFQGQAKSHGGFDAQLVDLAEFELPVFDEPHFPSQQKYTQEHTKRWAASADAADAFVFVTPEYNHGPPGGLLNALNYLYKEWNYKPVGFVSYAGISGGLRSVSIIKQLVVSLRMVPIVDSVIVPNYFPMMKDGVFEAGAAQEKSAVTMLNELALLAEALKSVRAKKAASS